MAYVINEPSVVSEVIAGEAIVINLDSGNYYSMDGSASYIWEQITSGGNADSIAQELAQSEGAEPGLRQVVEAFVDQLVTEGLIRQEAAGALGQPPTSLTPPKSYSAPLLNIYTDMQSLLLLDPIHQVDNAGWPHASESS